MKISTLILAIWLAASAWAQAPPPTQQQAAQAAAQSRKNQSGKEKAGAATPSKARHKPSASPAQVPVESHAWRRGRRQHRAERFSTGEIAQNGKPARKGQRDPFVSPIVERMRPGANCTGTGRQCLLVGDVTLQGVVQYTGGYVAVVTSGEHTYFLHDHDPLADGDVERITENSITLRQRSNDVLGRPVVHEVTRKIGTPAG